MYLYIYIYIYIYMCMYVCVYVKLLPLHAEAVRAAPGGSRGCPLHPQTPSTPAFPGQKRFTPGFTMQKCVTSHPPFHRAETCHKTPCFLKAKKRVARHPLSHRAKTCCKTPLVVQGKNVLHATPCSIGQNESKFGHQIRV